MKLRKFIIPVFVFLLLIPSIVFWIWYADNRMPNFCKEAIVYIYPGTSAQEALETIAAEARAKRFSSLSRSFRKKQVDTYIQPGCYIIKESYTSVYVARMLNNCWQSPVKMSLNGTVRSVSQIASKISSQMLADSASIATALCDKELLSSYGFSPTSILSMFIPDTYEIFWTASAKEILDRFKSEYDAFWTKERLSKAAAQGLSKEQVSILASIVSGETNYEPEMPRIAGVYLNRLHKGMKLQADPTIAYILNYQVNRILLKHLQIDSPYNTYRYAGLPPGPIAVPSKSCLEAVLNPEGDYLFFCANSTFDGTHLFAKTLSEHMKNARAFQKALNSRPK